VYVNEFALYISPGILYKDAGLIIMEKKECFGILEEVFPIGQNGLREVPAECLECPERVSCLKEALNTSEGLEMRSKNLERMPKGGLLGRIRRWSQKKELIRLADEKRKKT
jgi:hypothetical protein